MKYFTDVKTLDELKKAYRRLAMQYHPDCDGSTEAMQEINNEHDALFEILKRQHNAQAQADTTGKTKATTETAEEFRQILDILLRLDGLEIELCGSWLWIGGNTKANKDKLKAAGCRWSKSKGKWYWHHAEAGSRWYRGKSSMAEIRTKYGSQAFRSRGSQDIETATA